MIAEPLGKGLALRRSVKVRHVDQGCCLILNRLGQVRMPMAEQVDGDAACKVQVTLALFSVEINPFAANRTDRRARIDGHERRDGHGGRLPKLLWRSGPAA